MKADVERTNGRAGTGRALAGVAGSLRWLFRPIVPRGLSARLLVITILFVLASQIFIYVPSIASYRTDVLMQRLEAAQLAALALEAADNHEVGVDLSEELLANAGVLSVSLKRDEQRSLFLAPGRLPPRAVERFDLSTRHLADIADAFRVLLRRDDRVISVQGVPRLGGGVAIEAVMQEAPVRAAMLDYSRNILALSIVISVLAGAAVYAAIHFLLVRPMQRIERSMTHFRHHPEDPSATIEPSQRRDEVGSAERELAQMQDELRAALHQRARLAALGAAVSKINHDLRNMLSSAQLFVDRLETSEDPQVRRLAPKLIAAIGRAVNLCTNTLRFGRAEESPPVLRLVDLRKLAEDVGSNALPLGNGGVRWINEVEEDMAILADPDQMFRVLLNLARNSIQAIEHAGGEGEVRVNAASEPGRAVIELSDTGPGVPAAARARLFEPFSSVERPGGSGLGLAIASELVRAHGGTIALVETGENGTRFRITLPGGR